MNQPNSILYRKISDLFIVIPVLIVGSIAIPWLFFNDMQVNHRSLFKSFRVLLNEFPLIYAAMYLWLKAVANDLIRIKRGINSPMPGFIYFAYGLQWVFIVLGYIFLYESYRADSGSLLRQYFLFKNPVIFWILIEMVAGVLFWATNPDRNTNSQPLNLSKQKHYEWSMSIMKAIMRSYIVFMIVTIVGLFL